MVVITIVRWGYKPTYNVWGPHIVGFFEVFDLHGTGNADPVAVIEKLRSG